MKSSVIRKKLETLMQGWGFPVVFALLWTIWIFSSSLSLSPVPWPDGSAFYLPALDLIHWPPQWRMHAQAAWVPSYDIANFNLMPALPIYLGLLAKPWVEAGFDSAQVIRALSWIPLLLWSGLFWILLNRVFRLPRWGAIALWMCSLLDPIARWGTLVVRTEVWIACAGLGILLVAHRQESRDSRNLSWVLSGILALAAYFHFEAVFLVPGAAWSLLPNHSIGKREIRIFLKRALEVGFKTTLLLTPWLIYVAWHYDLFWIQMQTQFQRLEHGNHLVSNLYLTFHSQFLSFGNITDPPKILVIGKAIYWVLLLWLVGFFLWGMMRAKHRPNRLEQVAFLLFLGVGYLWVTKEELWFVALVHWAFWPWLAAGLNRLGLTRQRSWIFGSLALLSAWFFISTIGQQLKSPTDANWRTYEKWVGCLIETVEQQVPSRARERLVVFQPHVPDVLVRLSQLRPHWDLTRALDFPFLRAEAEKFMTERADVSLLTRVFQPGKHEAKDAIYYQGVPREIDRGLLSSELSIPFGSLALRTAGDLKVCQTGPFWGAVFVPRR